jgi:hypothetical protein
MSKTFRSEDHYDATPEEVYAALIDRDFIMEKYTSLGHTDIEITELAPTDAGGHRVATQREVEAAGVPDFVKKVVGERQTIVQSEEWSGPGDDGSRTSTWTVVTKGTPATVTGTSILRPDSDGTTISIVGEIKVAVPLIGGKIEGSVVPVFEAQARGEMEFGQEWLRRQS